ncbi:MAG TPA: hypothetical protein VGA10_06960, partial [Thermoanaerobaculia bacterium]
MRHILAAILLLAPLSVRADALTDLRATLAQLSATTPVHGAFEVTSTNTNSDEDQPSQGKASAGFEIGEAGLRILYPKATLMQANQEARAEAADPERQTPARSGISRIHALDLAELLDGAASLTTELLTAQLIDARSAMYRGKPARVVALKLSPKLSRSASKRVKKIDATLSVWLGDDGVPIAAERSFFVKASFMLMSFES